MATLTHPQWLGRSIRSAGSASLRLRLSARSALNADLSSWRVVAIARSHARAKIPAASHGATKTHAPHSIVGGVWRLKWLRARKE